ncbi:MAG: hypothetical protein ACLRSE_11580 [Alistipes finegoldii]
MIEAATDTVPNRMSFVEQLSKAISTHVIEPRDQRLSRESSGFSSGMPVRNAGSCSFTIDPDLLSTTLLSAEAVARVGASAQEICGPEQLRTRRAAGAYRRYQSDAARPVYGANTTPRRPPCVRPSRQVRNARLQVGYTRIYAPIDGIIASSNAHTGDYVGVGTQFCGADDHFEHRYR